MRPYRRSVGVSPAGLRDAAATDEHGAKTTLSVPPWRILYGVLRLAVTVGGFLPSRLLNFCAR
jgi:hypothetical protein